MHSYYFTEEHELFRDSLKTFLKKEVNPYIDVWEKEQQIPKKIWKKMGDQGFLGLSYPEKYGGSNLDFFYNVVLLEELSTCFSGGFGAALGATEYLFGAYMLKYASESLKQQYLPKIIDGSLVGCLAITEPSAGSDVANIKTRARKNGDHYILNGSKTFITNGYYGDVAVVVAKTGDAEGFGSVSLFLVELNSEGVSRSKLNKLGWHASDTAEIGFDQVMVPSENLIGEEGKGFYYLMGNLQLERLILAIGGYSSCEVAIEYSLNYMKERHAFNRPLTKFQELRHRIAQLAAETESCKQFVLYCCKLHDDRIYAVKECSMAKLIATELSDKVTYQCIQFFGGYGFIEDYKIAHMFRDSRVGTIGGGSSEIMQEIIAKMVIDDVSYQSATTNKSNNSHLNTNKNMSELSNILEGIKTKAASAAPLGNTLKFDFGDEQLYIDGTGGTNEVTAENKDADCLIEVGMDDFKALMQGDLNPMAAVMGGKIKIKGDMGVAMKLQSLFG